MVRTPQKPQYTARTVLREYRRVTRTQTGPRNRDRAQLGPAGLPVAATLYTSTEPCAMCAGAVYWSGIRRVVYALGEDELCALAGASGHHPLSALPSRKVFAHGNPVVDVVGPFLYESAAAVHDDFWT
ncbi:deaminase [Streptomyces sp. NBC_00237]|uniref:deaminase n=1 Tax=Streptomyces sp. NBC_00237 TaxID=2975687 RepID=UPI002B1E3F94|nr:deaminase [Streptomyces sp. NBC_00237]